MRYPKFLQTGGKIAFVAPSFGCATEPYKSGFQRAQKRLQEQGFGLELGPNCYAGTGVGISNAPDKCGEELTEYYCNKTGDCIISCGGGELMCEILDHVDFGRIGEADPKWYMGYSDNTNMTFLLATLCDTASIYGPCASSFGMEPLHQSLADALALLQGKKLVMEGYGEWELESLKDEEHPFVPYNLTETSVIKYILPDGRTNIESLAQKRQEAEAEEVHSGKGRSTGTEVVRSEERQRAETEANPAGHDQNVEIDFSGRLLGGCVDCLINLLGTEYDRVREFTERYKDDGIIWFLEACDLNLMGIRRAMWQMEHAGWFQHCKGFLIGRPRTGMKAEEFGIDHYQAACEMIRKYNVPVMMDLDIGHLPPMMPLICGSMAQVVSDGRKYRVEMNLR
ncbi:MAG: LD-carboxypeptidase [Lachnospiraceae bacterium]|nr:LD-carboxypeptidase [Lachnospiraceae bacterium]